jgi:prepilin-type N-terminal cleavage/methylation domain-containing protein
MRWGRSGVSLIELLLVIALIGILVALGAGGLRGLLDRGRLSEAINKVTTSVEEARRLAKRLDRDVVVAFAQQDGRWVVVVDGAARELAADVTSGSASVTFEPPFGTYGGAQLEVSLAVRDVAASVFVTGVLGKTVVRR